MPKEVRELNDEYTRIGGNLIATMPELQYIKDSKARIEFAEKNPIMDYDKKTKIKTEINNVESKNIFDL